MTRLETERLILRPLTLEDADAIARHVGNLDVSRWLTVVPHPYTIEDAIRFLDDRVPFGTGGHFNFAIMRKNSPNLIGLVALDTLSEECENLKELGYWLASDWWRKGIVSEAATKVVNWAFCNTEITQLHAGCHDGNTGSRRILEALGFTLTGEKQVYSVALDTERTSLQFELGRRDWKEG